MIKSSHGKLLSLLLFNIVLEILQWNNKGKNKIRDCNGSKIIILDDMIINIIDPPKILKNADKLLTLE